jgi:hypothetical protein
MILLPAKGTSYDTTFDTHFDPKIIQIGANASVGYGLCKFEKQK